MNNCEQCNDQQVNIMSNYVKYIKIMRDKADSFNKKLLKSGGSIESSSYIIGNKIKYTNAEKTRYKLEADITLICSIEYKNNDSSLYSSVKLTWGDYVNDVVIDNTIIKKLDYYLPDSLKHLRKNKTIENIGVMYYDMIISYIMLSYPFMFDCIHDYKSNYPNLVYIVGYNNIKAINEPVLE